MNQNSQASYIFKDNFLLAITFLMSWIQPIVFLSVVIWGEQTSLEMLVSFATKKSFKFCYVIKYFPNKAHQSKKKKNKTQSLTRCYREWDLASFKVVTIPKKFLLKCGFPLEMRMPVLGPFDSSKQYLPTLWQFSRLSCAFRVRALCSVEHEGEHNGSFYGWWESR